MPQLNCPYITYMCVTTDCRDFQKDKEIDYRLPTIEIKHALK